jgi:hypothetical protein
MIIMKINFDSPEARLIREKKHRVKGKRGKE